MRKGRIAIGIAALVLSMAAGLVPARAADLYYVSGPGEQFRGYSLPVYAIRAGDRVTYLNLDLATHNVVSGSEQVIYGPDTPECAQARFPIGSCPLFWTVTTSLVESGPIYGIDKLPAGGQFPFKCTFHPAQRGTLVVLPA